MTLVIDKSPADVSLVGNDILFKINTDNQYSTPASKSNLGIYWTTGDNNTKSFILSWGIHSVEFECEDVPDNSGTQYPPYVSGSVNEWVESLVPYLRANYLLIRDFIIVWNASQNVIQLTPYNAGADYLISVNDDDSFILIDTNVAGVDAVARDYYKLIACLWLPGTTDEDYIQIGEDHLIPDPDGNVLFKFQEYLADHIACNLHYPEDNTNTISIISGFIQQFFIRYAEFYDGSFYELISTEEYPTFVIPGKISQQRVNQLAEIEWTFFDELQATQMFLSWHPTEKTISKWQPEKLFFLNYLKTNYLNVYIDLIYSDNSTDTILLKQITSGNYDVLEICCGHDILGLQYLDKSVSSYKIYVKDTRGDIISEIRRFVIDDSFQEFEQVFLFLNSLGVYESLRTTGIISKTNLFEHNLIDQVIIDNENIYRKQNNFQTWMQETFQVNSGWITKDQVNWFNDFIFSTDRYILEDFNKVDILVTSTKVFQHKDDERLYFIEFDFKKSILADSFTNDPRYSVLITEDAIPVLTEDDELILI